MGKKAVLGLSGGVDSAVAAQRLVERGFEVVCIFLDNGVTSPENARRAAEELDLPFQVADITKSLWDKVCVPFGKEYLAGRTPSPCAVCNGAVKFPALLEMADRLGADLVATGHYAKVADGADGGVYLMRGEPESDQSYMLGRLSREQLARCIFPLGGYEKAEVRAMAADYGLSAAETPDSMEICFIPDNDYGSWLEARFETPGAGDFVDREGKVLGRHRGYHRYTLGQGRGLGVSGPHKYYVSAILPEENRVVLGDGSDLFTHEVRCFDMNWLSVDGLASPKVVTARFRHSREETAALLYPQGDGSVLCSTGPAVRAPAKGQMAVFYEGDLVVGSGWIG